MMELRRVLEQARDSLKGNWGLAIGVSLLAIIIPLVPMFTITPFFGPGSVEWGLDQLIRIFLAAPLVVGVKWIFVGFFDGVQKGMGNLFDGFRNFWRAVGIPFLSGIFVLLWSLAPIIPAIIVGSIIIGVGVAFESFVLLTIGALIMFVPSIVFAIVATIRYSQAPYLVNDNPSIDVLDAIGESKKMMKGYKWQYFLLHLFFFLWQLPGVVLIFIAAFFLIYAAVPLLEFMGNAIINNPYIIESPAMLENMIMDALNRVSFDERTFLFALLFVLIGVIYLIGISFYIIPYRYAAGAAFYRTLQPRVEEDEENINGDSLEVETNEYWDNNLGNEWER